MHAEQSTKRPDRPSIAGRTILEPPGGAVELNASSDRSLRLRVYRTVTLLLFVVALIGGVVKSRRSTEPLNFIRGDGRGYYVYLPSLVIDGDLDFRNQMLATYGEELGLNYDINDLTELGLVRNKYPIGMALTLAPAFLAGHCIAIVAHALSGSALFAVDGYSPAYQVCCVGLILALSYLTMRMLDSLIERHFDIRSRAILLAVLGFWLGTNYVWYCVREMFMVHIVSCFWVTSIVYLCSLIRIDAVERRACDGMKVALLAGALGMAVVCRPTNLFIAPILVWMLLGVHRARILDQFMRKTPLAVIIGAMPLIAQLIAGHEMTGHWLQYGYADERFVWTHPALLQTLFSIHHKGLLVWTPIVALALIGLGWQLLRNIAPGRTLIIAWLLGGAILWYCNSGWWYWSFGSAFGARAFIELGGLFVVGLAFLFEWTARQPVAILRAVACTTILCVALNGTLMSMYLTHRIQHSDPLAGGWEPAGAPRRWFAEMDRLKAEQDESPAMARTE